MAVDDDATREAPVEEPSPTSDLGPAPEPDAVLAYSDHTTSMPVVDYQPPRLRPLWIVGLVLAAAATVAAAAFFLGRTTAPSETTSTPDVVPSSAPPKAAAVPAPPAAPPVTVTLTPPALPPTVTMAAPAQPTATTSVPPLATPEARIAEPIICSLHNQYPQMQPVDLALSLLDRNIYRDYDEASLVVRLVLKDGCHGI